MLDYTLILRRKYPDAQWTLDGDEYAGLTWLSDTPKPTKKELDDLWSIVQDEIAQERADQAAKKQAALDKLVALGLTLDDLKLLGFK